MSISDAPPHAFLDLLHAQVVGRQPRGKPGGDGGDGDAGACERIDGGGHHVVIDANRARGDRGQAERVEDVGGTGWRALAQSRRTRPSVSSPASVVRSISVMARASHAAWYAFFTVRRPGREAARRSMAEVLACTRATQSRSSAMPALRASWICGNWPVVPACSDGAAVCGWVMGWPSGGILREGLMRGLAMASLTKRSNFGIRGHSRDRIRPAPTSATAAIRVQLTSRTTMPKAPGRIEDQRGGKLSEDECGDQRDDAERADGRRGRPDIDRPQRATRPRPTRGRRRARGH
jgi:hypothetical protein